MKHCLEVMMVVYPEYTLTLDAAEDKIRGVDASKLWVEQQLIERGVENGNPYLFIQVRFNEDADMQVIKDWMKTKGQQVLSQLVPETCYVDHHPCPHDTKQGCPKPIRAWSN